MTGMKPRKWFQARLRWAVLKEGRGLHHWRESECFFVSKDRETAFQEALRIGYEGECWLNPAPNRRNAPRLHCRFAEVQYVEELGTDPAAFKVYLGEKPAHEVIGFDHDFDPAGHVPAPIF
jgi:hypothetical protein